MELGILLVKVFSAARSEDHIRDILSFVRDHCVEKKEMFQPVQLGCFKAVIITGARKRNIFSRLQPNLDIVLSSIVHPSNRYRE